MYCPLVRISIVQLPGDFRHGHRLITNVSDITSAREVTTSHSSSFSGWEAQARIDHRRLLITADRVVADVALFRLLRQLGVRFVIRVKANTHVAFWRGSGNASIRFDFGVTHGTAAWAISCMG